MVQIGEGGLLPRLEAQQRAIRTLSLHSRPIAYVGSPGSMQHPWSAGRCRGSTIPGIANDPQVLAFHRSAHVRGQVARTPVVGPFRRAVSFLH
jgi:hypothetical protein